MTDQPDLFGEVKPKQKNKSKPVQRSMDEMRKNGWSVAQVEKWIPPRGEMKYGVRKDVWGFGDLLICRADIYGQACPTCYGLGKRRSAGGMEYVCEVCAGEGKTLIGPKGIALVQCCRDADMAAHKAKILAIPEYYIWRKSGGRVFLQGWAKRGARGQVKRWRMREEEIMEDF